MKDFKITKEMFDKVKEYWYEHDKNWRSKGCRITDKEGFMKLYNEIINIYKDVHSGMSDEITSYISDVVLERMLANGDTVRNDDIENQYYEAFGDGTDTVVNGVITYRTLIMLHFIVTEIKICSNV